MKTIYFLVAVFLACGSHAAHPAANHIGRWDAPTKQTPSTSVSDGPLMAGGDFGAAVALMDGAASYFFGKNDVWSDATYEGGDGWLFRHVAVANLAIFSSNGSGVAASQELYPPRVNISLGGAAVNILGSFAKSRERLIVIPISSESGAVRVNLSVPMHYPGKVNLEHLGGLPAGANATSEKDLLVAVRKNNYARFIPAVVGRSFGHVRGFSRFSGPGQVFWREMFREWPVNETDQCLAPLPIGASPAPWTSNDAGVSVVMMDCVGVGGSWSFLGGGSAGALQFESAQGSKSCASVVSDDEVVYLGPCSNATQWMQIGPDSDGLYSYCLDANQSSCLLAQNEGHDRNAAIAVGVLQRTSPTSPWSKTTFTSISTGEATVAASIDIPFSSSSEASVALVVAAATILDMDSDVLSQISTPLHDVPPLEVPALQQAMRDARAVSDPDVEWSEHVAWWEDYYSQVSVSIGDQPCTDPTTRGCSLEAFFAAMDWMRGATAAKNAVMPSLWGPFNNLDPSGWRDDFTIDYNVEANVFGAASTGREEVLQAYAAFSTALTNTSALRATATNWTISGGPHATAMGTGIMDTARPVPRASTGNVPNISFAGLSAPNSMGPFGGQAFYTDWGNRWPMGMFVASLVEWFEYSQDWTVMNSTTFPMLVGVADFYASYASKWNDTNQYDFWPSCGQENCRQRTGKQNIVWERSVTADLAVATRALASAVHYAQYYPSKVSPNRIAKWNETLQNLVPFAVTTYNDQTVVSSGLDNFGDPVDPVGNVNTPLLNTMPVYPTFIVTLDSDPSLVQAFNNTAWLLAQSAHFAPQNGLCSAWPPLPRLCDNTFCASSMLAGFESAIQRTSFPNFWPNLGGGGLEQIGAVDAVVAMLINSDLGYVKFFPSWPSDLAASFHGLRARGGLVFDASISSQGEISSPITFNTTQTNTIFRFQNPFSHSPTIKDESGKVYPVSKVNNIYQVSLPTVGTYELQ